MAHKIIGPRDRTITVSYGSNKMTVKLTWDPSFATSREDAFNKAQRFIDSECLRRMSPYMPYRTGALERSGVLGTVIGSGELHQITPYARYQYYGKVMVSPTTGSAYAKKGERKVLTDKDIVYGKTHPKAGKLWFERMKADSKGQILKGAAKIVGGEVVG